MHSYRKNVHFRMASLATLCFLWLTVPTMATEDERLDSLEQMLPRLEQKVLSTLMFGGSSPVSFSGEARLKVQLHNLTVIPDWMYQDRNAVASGWEGNESLIRLGMVVRAGRNAILWSRIGFQHTLPGNRYIDNMDQDGYKLAQTRHDKSTITAAIHEDMSAGIALRTRPASFWLKMGTVQWLEASPLTIWKSQPRTFAWEYQPFEIEQPTARYYEYALAKGEKAGRAAWNKKPFQGLTLESINLPAQLYCNILYGTVPRFDSFEREFLDMSNDLAYAGESFPIKSSGVGDSYRRYLHVRAAKINAFNGLTLGTNFSRLNWNDDVVFMQDANGNLFLKAFEISSTNSANNVYTLVDTGTGIDSVLVSPGSGFVKEPFVASVDIKGTTNGGWKLAADLALSRLDTTWLIADTNYHFGQSSFAPGDLKPALYAQVGREGPLAWQVDAACIAPGFYSPFSFVIPADIFYAFGTNQLGAGKFFAGSESSPYVQNMTGLLLTLKPQLPGYGHLTFKYGQHAQLKEARDLLALPYRLNGQDMFSMFHSSYNRWGSGTIDHSLANKNTAREPWWRTPTVAYQKRLGDESFRTSGFNNPLGPDAGGMWSDNLGMYETFVPYQDSLSALGNVKSITSLLDRSASMELTDENGVITDTVTSNESFLPQHRKFTFNFEVDGALDIGPFLNYDNDFFLGGYAAISGVSTTFKPLAFSDKSNDMMLWSLYLRFEPAIALHPDFYLVGLAGYENWRAQNAWMAFPSDLNDRIPIVKRVPLNYRDIAFGLGFDWTMLERTGLHGRLKWFRHTDSGYTPNNFSTILGSLEIKMWF